MRPAVVSVGFGRENVTLEVVWFILNTVFTSTVVAAVPIVPVAAKFPSARAENTVAPLWVTVPLNVLSPANVWVPVFTRPRAVGEASGILKVWTLPAETILKSFPAVPTANVCVAPVWPPRDPIFELKLIQSAWESAPVVVAEARAREIPLPAIESPFADPDTTPTLLLNVVQSVPVSAPVVVEFAFQIENTPVVLLYERGQRAEREVRPILLLNIVQSAPVRRPVDVALAFQIAIVTFGQTVEFAPLVMVIAVLAVEIDPNVRADCLLAMVVSWAVLLPWSFWRATRRESAAVTVPDPATNPVRREERDIFPEKAL
jgi:hypothetical protein